MTPAARFWDEWGAPRHWRRGLSKAVRRPVRVVRRYHPSPVVGALLLGVIVGGGLTAITVGAIADGSPTDQAVISQSLTDGSRNGTDGAGPWDRFGGQHGMHGIHGFGNHG